MMTLGYQYALVIQLTYFGVFSMLARSTALSMLSLICFNAHAAGTTWVGPFGQNAGNCTMAAPCATFDYALTQTDIGGQIIALDSGKYSPVTVNKSVTIAAAPGANVILEANSSGAAVFALGTGIRLVLKGLQIKGDPSMQTILFNGGDELTIENCVVANGATGLTATPAAGGQVRIKDSTFRDNGVGMSLSGSGAVTERFYLDNVRIEGSTNGSGLLIDGAKVTMVNSRLIGNLASGVWVRDAALTVKGSSVVIDKSTIAANGGDGVLVEGSVVSRVTVANSVVSNNGTNGIRTISTVASTVYLDGNTINNNASYGLWCAPNQMTKGLFRSHGTSSLHGNNGGGAQRWGVSPNGPDAI